MLHSPQSDSKTAQQPLGELTFRYIWGKVWRDAYAKYITIGSFIYLTVQLLAIITGDEIIVPERLRLPTILIAIFLIFSYPLYKIYKNLIEQNRNLGKQIEISKEQNINLINQIGNLNQQNINLSNQIGNFSKQIENLTNIKPKDPSNLIYGHLGYPDVKFAIYSLSKKIKDLKYFDKDSSGRNDAKKNIIIGIDRGGAIVGGLLAKDLGVAIQTLAINYANKLSKTDKIEEPDPSTIRETSIITEKSLENIDFNDVTKILLVDDAIRKGDAMNDAKNFLKGKLKEKGKNFTFICDGDHPQRFNEIEIDIACILFQHEDVTKLKIRLPRFCVYQTKTVERWLLWDTTRDEIKIEGEEKDLFDKYYELIPSKLLPQKKLVIETQLERVEQ